MDSAGLCAPHLAAADFSSRFRVNQGVNNTPNITSVSFLNNDLTVCVGVIINRHTIV
jgi:hypothetical protein